MYTHRGHAHPHTQMTCTHTEDMHNHTQMTRTQTENMHTHTHRWHVHTQRTCTHTHTWHVHTQTCTHTEDMHTHRDDAYTHSVLNQLNSTHTLGPPAERVHVPASNKTLKPPLHRAKKCAVKKRFSSKHDLDLHSQQASKDSKWVCRTFQIRQIKRLNTHVKTSYHRSCKWCNSISLFSRDLTNDIYIYISIYI